MCTLDPDPRKELSTVVSVRGVQRSKYSSVSELSYSDAGSCTVAASGMSELIGVELVRQGNRIPSLEGLGLNGDNAPKRFRRPHDKSWVLLARPGCSLWGAQLVGCSAKAVRSGALLSTRGSSFSPQWLGSSGPSRRCARGTFRSVGGCTPPSIAAMHRSHAESCCTPMAMADEGVAVLHVFLNEHSDASGLSPRVRRHDRHRAPVSRLAAARLLRQCRRCIWSALVKLDRLCLAWVRCLQLGLANAMPASLMLAGAAQRPRRVAELHAFSCCGCDA